MIYRYSPEEDQIYLTGFMTHSPLVPQKIKNTITKEISHHDIFLLFSKLLNNEEIAIINHALLTLNPFLLMNQTSYDALNLLKHSRYLKPFGKNRYFISPDFLSYYQKIVENDESTFPLLFMVHHEKIDFISHAEQYRRIYENSTFSHCLHLNYTDEELDFICNVINIPDHKTMKNLHKCDAISKKFLSDFTLIDELFKYIPQIRVLLSFMVLEDRNSYLGAELPENTISAFMLFCNSDYEIVYLPFDVFNHVKNYFEEKKLDPNKILKKHIQNFCSKKATLQEEEQAIEDFVFYSLNDEQIQNLLYALSNDRIYADTLNDYALDLKLDFFTAIVYLYGVISLENVLTLFNQFFNEKHTLEDLKNDLNVYDDDASFIVQDDLLILKFISQGYQLFNEIYLEIPYYQPQSLNELLSMFEASKMFIEKEAQPSVEFLRQNIHASETKDRISSALLDITLVEELLLPSIRMLPSLNDLNEIIKEWRIHGLFKGVSNKELLKHITNIYQHTRLWTLRGHTFREYLQCHHHKHPDFMEIDNTDEN